MYKFLFLLIAIIYFGCNNPSNQNVKYLSISGMQFEVPSDFELHFEKGVEGKSFVIKNNKINIKGDFGTPYKVLFDYPLPIFDIKDKYALTKNDSINTGNYFFSLHPSEDLSWGTFNVNFYLYDSTNDILKIVIQPKIIGKGITGVYVEDPKTEKVFNMYAENLDSSSHKILMKMIYSMKK